MKKKIVIWANDENDKKILVGLELKAEDNKIAIHTFPEEIATEVFYNEMMENWRNDKEVAFPEGHTTQEKPLSITESILPDNIKVTKSDIVNRAATEWQFIVLSTKLYEMYKSELAEKKEKVMEMTQFDNGVWAEMKEFWNKVQGQVFDNNLLRDHANQLKEHTNSIFEKLKKLRSSLDKEFDELSKRNKGVFNAKLVEIDEKINKGLGLKPIFEELKKLQNEYKDTKFNRKDRAEIWDRLDSSFKKVKAKKPGGGQKSYSDGNNPLQRIQRRYDGLMSAIGKMQHSVNRDQKDIDYETRKINTTDGQLEQQIRQAKLKMINERLNSKKLKLADMNKTKADLESKLEKEKKKAEVSKAKDAAKAKIASQMEQKSASISDKEKSTLEKAAEDIAKKKAPKEDAKTDDKVKGDKPAEATQTVESKVEEVADKAKDVSAPEPPKEVSKKEAVKEEAVEAVETKVEDVAAKVSDKAEDVLGAVGDKVEEAGAGILGAVGGLMNAAKDMVEDAIDSVQAVGAVAKDQISESLTGEKNENELVPSATKNREDKVDALLNANDKVEEPKKEGISGGLLGAAAGLLGGVVAGASELASEAKEKLEELGEIVENKVEDLADAVSDKADKITGEEE